LSTQSLEIGGRPVVEYVATVESEDGSRPTGLVTLVEDGAASQGAPRSLASAALDAEGKAVVRLDSLGSSGSLDSLASTDKPATPRNPVASLHAVYTGDLGHEASESGSLAVHAEATAAPDFTVSLSPASMTLTAGQSGTAVMTVTPINGFTGFLSLSCSGLPIDEITCTFTPITLQIVSSTTPVTATLGVQTLAPAGTSAANHAPGPARSAGASRPLMLAILLPGALALGLLGRKRKWLMRVSLLALTGVLMTAGMSACAARYRYLNHGPVVGGTPVGSYTLTVTAQTSNGETANAHSTSLGVTVK
jgi:hypothetical protein